MHRRGRASLLSPSELTREYRGRHDIYNVVVGGFATGGIISRNNGTKAGLLAGAGFAAFGAAIDHFWVERQEPDEP